MAAPQLDFPSATAAYGGFTALAKRLGLSLSTVHGWHIRDKVPSWRRAEIIAAAREDGMTVCTTDPVVIMRKAAKKKKAKAKAKAKAKRTPST